MLFADVTFEKHLFPFPPASVRPECQRVPVRLPCVFLNHLSVKVSQPPHPLPRLPQCQIKRQKKRKKCQIMDAALVLPDPAAGQKPHTTLMV